ncbi:MAG: hypothetical protein CMQ40_00060 [Gammaproteobacteria bacterium]|nr:hypothetical protein [Gammaproteobacteria bacterium]
MSERLMETPTITLSDGKEKSLLQTLLGLSRNKVSERNDVMGAPVPVFNISMSPTSLFREWKGRHPTLPDLQELIKQLERLSQRMIEFEPEYDPVPVLHLSRLYHDKELSKQAGIQIQLNGYAKLANIIF